MFNINDIYIGRIYDISGLESHGAISNGYSAFIKSNDEKNFKDDYILINRGELNRKTFKFRHGTVLNQINDIDIFWEEEIPMYYVADLKPIVQCIEKHDLKTYITSFELYFELLKINMKEESKKLILKK